MNLSPFGQLLRRWRRVRHMSQLELATAAGASARHISFVETGRSRPGEELILRLAETLEVPLRERNELLRAAGLSPIYAEQSLDDAALAPYRRIVDQMLDNHAPYPGLVIDRWWRLVRVNDSAKLMFGGFEPGADLLALLLESPAMAALIENLGEVAHATLERLRAEAAELPDDARMQALLERGEELAGRWPAPLRPTGPVVCPILRVGDQRIRTVTAIARFGTARDVTLDELRVELIYPGDAAAEQFFAQLGG